MKQIQPLIVGAVGALLGVLLVLVSGVLNFAASSGHWDVTDLFFDMAARQSVTLRSVEITSPALKDPAMIQRGAGQYEMVCAACHGSPGRAPEAFAANLTPKPPLLLEQMQRWRPSERVFWTVKHGIKRTGMPAWATQLRDDEVWDITAFLFVMPGLTAEAYRDLAGDRRAANTCVNCHGDNGQGRGGAFPRLDLQSPEYLAGALLAFREGTRASGPMITAAAGLSDEDIVALAAYYGRGVPEVAVGAADGEVIARHGIADRDIPACDSCHGDTARTDFPRLAGQESHYILTQLRLFAELGEARGGPHAALMAEAVRGLSEDQMRAVAEWYGR